MDLLDFFKCRFSKVSKCASLEMLNVFMLINGELPWDQQLFAWQLLADVILWLPQPSLQPRTKDFYTLHASALGSPVLWACMAYHSATEPFLLYDVSGAALAGQKFDELTIWKVASYYGATLKVTELSEAILLPMYVYGDCMAVCSILYICHLRC